MHMQPSATLRQTLLTLAVGAVGAALGWAVGAPVYMLLGPALAVSAAALAGLRTDIAPRLREAGLVVLGVAVGTGFDSDALTAMLTWPLAFLFMAAVIWGIMICCRWLLVRFFGFEPRAALLAAAPGHLSFVIALAQEMRGDVARVTLVQSVRLLALTLCVPFIALALGVEVPASIAPRGEAMGLVPMLAIFPLSVALGLGLKLLHAPAPLLLGGMIVSAVGRTTSSPTSTSLLK